MRRLVGKSGGHAQAFEDLFGDVYSPARQQRPSLADRARYKAAAPPAVTRSATLEDVGDRILAGFVVLTVSFDFGFLDFPDSIHLPAYQHQ